MGRRSWWYEVSRNEYEETKTSYGSDVYALDTRMIAKPGTKHHNPFPKTEVIIKPNNPRQSHPPESIPVSQTYFVKAIKRDIRKLEDIIKSSEALSIKKTAFTKALGELRIIYKNCRDLFSASEIDKIQRLKIQFEKTMEHRN